MKFLHEVLLFLVCAFVTSSASDDNFTDCTRSLAILEKALYAGSSNVFELHKAFVPPNSRPSRFTKVNYTFLNKEGVADNCSVTYIWAIGAFLFIQPPSLFRLTSLNFNYPNNNLPPLNLTLPYECRALVNVSGSCSCDGNNHALLNVLTQQVCTHLKFNCHACIHL